MLRSFATILLFIVIAMAQTAAQNPPYLSDFPKVDDVLNKFKSDTALDNYAMKVGALQYLVGLVDNLAEKRRFTTGLTNDEKALIEVYKKASGELREYYNKNIQKLEGDHEVQWRRKTFAYTGGDIGLQVNEELMGPKAKARLEEYYAKNKWARPKVKKNVASVKTGPDPKVLLQGANTIEPAILGKWFCSNEGYGDFQISFDKNGKGTFDGEAVTFQYGKKMLRIVNEKNGSINIYKAVIDNNELHITGGDQVDEEGLSFARTGHPDYNGNGKMVDRSRNSVLTGRWRVAADITLVLRADGRAVAYDKLKVLFGGSSMEGSPLAMFQGEQPVTFSINGSRLTFGGTALFNFNIEGNRILTLQSGTFKLPLERSREIVKGEIMPDVVGQWVEVKDTSAFGYQNRTTLFREYYADGTCHTFSFDNRSRDLVGVLKGFWRVKSNVLSTDFIGVAENMKEAYRVPEAIRFGANETTRNTVMYLSKDDKFGVALIKKFSADGGAIAGNNNVEPGKKANQMATAGNIDVCAYFPLRKSMNYVYRAGPSIISDEYVSIGNKTVGGKIYKGYRIESNEEARDGGQYYYHCDNGILSVHAEVPGYKTVLSGYLVNGDGTREPQYTAEQYWTGKFNTFTELNTKLPEGTSWSDKIIIRKDYVTVSSKIAGKGLTVTAREKEYTDVIKVERELIMEINGVESIIATQQVYYAKGVGIIKLENQGTAATLLGLLMPNSKELEQYTFE